jgi:hypothetical protein
MAEPALNDNPPIPLSTVPILGVADVISLAEVAAKRAEKFGATIDTLAKGVAARASEVEASLLNADFPRRDIEAAVAKAAAKARAEVTANSSDARWNALRELDAAAASLETTAQLYANPVAVLARAGIGTAERTNFLTQLSGAGPVELRQMALLAASTGNRVMGAALVSIIDRMPRKDRPFSAADLAERLVGDETRKVQAAIAAVRHAAQTAIVRNRSWESGKARPLNRIKLALNNPHRKDA